MTKALIQSALALLLTAAGTIGVTSAASAAQQSGPYHHETLPNGQHTGPIAPHANGG